MTQYIEGNDAYMQLGVRDIKKLSSIKKKRPSSLGNREKTAPYILILPAVIITFFISYLPLRGIIMAFQDYDPFRGLLDSTWVGLNNYNSIFGDPRFLDAIKNTLMIGITTLILGFFLSLVFALLLNDLQNMKFKRIVQTVSYLPYFLATIAVIGMVATIYDPYGPINDIIVYFTHNDNNRQLFLANNNLFFPNVIFIHLWKNVGWDSILFLAAIAGIDQQQYEAAKIDGATRLQQALYITIPGLSTMAVIIILMRVGFIVNDNFELIYGLQNAYTNFEVVGTIVYKEGIGNGNVSLATAFGLAQGLCAFIITLVGNWVAKKFSGVGLF